MSATLHLHLTVAAAALACATSLVFALRAASQVPRSTQMAGAPLPRGLRAAARTGEVLAYFCAPLLPAATATAWSTRLRQAELDRALSLQQWFGMRLLCGLVLAVLCLWIVAPSGGLQWLLVVAAGLSGYLVPGLWLHDRVATRKAGVLKELPAYLDLLTLAVEAGGSLTSALRMAVEKAPPSMLRRVFERILGDIRSGRSRMDALAGAAGHYQLAPLSAVVNALIQAESAGMSLGSILRAQAEQRLNERFAAAEKLAMLAPVKMLGPLILCIFPCTFIVIGFPIAVRLMGGLDS
jgi:tight adherence protein C